MSMSPGAFAEPCPPARLPPSLEYQALVTRYASGEHAAAVLALGEWSDDRLRCDLDNLQAAAVAFSRCRECEDRLVFERFSVRAALLLHADREIGDQFRDPVSEQGASCRTGKQAQVVGRLAAMLALVDPEAQAFLSRFYLGMVRRAHWSHCSPQAQQWARTGLKRLPRDGRLMESLGIVLETLAFLTPVPAAPTVQLGTRAAQQSESWTVQLAALWERARRTFDEALAADPNLHEARLRLGRVLWRISQPEQARARFEEVLSKSNDQALLYLGHLFLGRIHEDQNRLAEAEMEYRAAGAIWPLSEAPAVALSHVLLLMGDPEGAREALESGLGRVRFRTEVDPYKEYPMAHAREGATILDELRKALTR